MLVDGDPLEKNHMIPQDTSIKDENAGGIFILTAHDHRAVEHKK